jgi:hypothetical protein
VINALDVLSLTEEPLYTEQVSLSEVIVYQNKKLLAKELTLRLYGDRLTLTNPQDQSWAFPFSDVNAITILGKNKLNIYHEKHVYQIKGNQRFNALKYVQLYHRYRNMTTGDGQGDFLGM